MKGIYFLMGEKDNSLPQMAQKAVELLKAKGKKVAYFKPVGNDETSLVSVELAKDLVARGHKDKIIEEVIAVYREFEEENDFVVCEGTDGSSRDLVIEFRLNAILADNLCLPAVVAMGPENEGAEQSFYFVKKMLEQRRIPVLGRGSLDEGELDAFLEEAALMQSDKITPKMFEYRLIEKAQAKRAERTEVTADRVVTELAKIAFADPRDLMEWGPDGLVLKDCRTIPDAAAATVSEVSESKDGIKLKKLDKLKALELLGRISEFTREAPPLPLALRIAKSRLSSDFRNHCPIAVLAEELRMPLRTFNRMFRDHLGISPHEFRRRCRVETAKEYLNHTNASVKEIAERLGYCNAFHFSGEFRRAAGSSPLQFRTACRQKKDPE